jgi:hypothetical protein
MTDFILNYGIHGDTERGNEQLHPTSTDCLNDAALRIAGNVERSAPLAVSSTDLLPVISLNQQSLERVIQHVA